MFLVRKFLNLINKVDNLLNDNASYKLEIAIKNNDEEGIKNALTKGADINA